MIARGLTITARTFAEIPPRALVRGVSVSGCFMFGSWTQGEMLRIGIYNNKKNGYLMITNDKWRSVEVG
jgi:hypothetical protein